MNSLKYIIRRYKIDSNVVSPVVLPRSRDDLALLFKELNFKKGAEIGVERGIYSEALCKANSDLKLYCIDPWKDYEEYTEGKDQRWYSDNYIIAKKRLKLYNCEIIKKSSMSAIKDFAPDSLDFVFIDANHSFDYALEDISGWSKIVKKGGIISGHDYKDNKNMHPGVFKAVDLYVKEHNKKLFLLRKKYHPGSRFVDSSWFFIR